MTESGSWVAAAHPPLKLGADALVHRGKIHGQSVATKKFGATGCESIAEFQRKIVVLSACRHENIVSLLAFSMESNTPLCLVYPFISGGALSDALRDRGRRASLDAAARLRIAADSTSNSSC